MWEDGSPCTVAIDIELKKKKIQRAEDLGPVVLCTGSILGKPGMKKTTSAQVLSQKF